MCTFLQHVEKKYIHGYDAHKAFYQNCKIHGPWVSSSGTTTGPIWAYNEGILNHRTSSSLLSYICGKKINSLLLMNQWSPLPEIYDLTIPAWSLMSINGQNFQKYLESSWSLLKGQPFFVMSNESSCYFKHILFNKFYEILYCSRDI